MHREGVDPGIFDAVPLAVVIHEFVPPELPKDVDLFFDPGAAILEVHIEVSIFEIVPPDAGAEDESAVTEGIEGGRLLGDEWRFALREDEYSVTNRRSVVTAA